MRRHDLVIGLALTLAILAFPPASDAQIICVSNNIPPPELPVYAQPEIPTPGYIWTPGYWAGGPNGYFWVPGTWVMPPEVGLLWTPGYWAWRDGIYTWSAGYWGPHVGFYGGINYGFGYIGVGYEGGRWENGVFAYNRTVNNFGGMTITNVYEKTVVVDPNTARVSFNGGSGGIEVRPTPEQEAAAHEQHIAAIPAQLQHERTASIDKSLLASENHGRPAIAATARPGDFTGKGVVAAREAEPTTRPQTKPAGAAAVGPNPAGEKHPEKEERPGQGQATINGGAPAKQPNTEIRPLNTEAKPLNTETKPLNTEVKPSNTEAKPLNTEAKPSNTEAKPLNTEAKPRIPEGKPSTSEAKLPPQEAKPQLAAPPKAPNSPPPSHVTATPPHPAAAAPHPKPSPEDKKHPPG